MLEIHELEVEPKTLNLDHLFRMTDCTGIIQHAVHSLPDLETGYTTDDNARALICAVKTYGQTRRPEVYRLAETYLAFLNYVQREDGLFHNFVDYSRSFRDERGSEDSFGRSVWALGYTVYSNPEDRLGMVADMILGKALPHVTEMEALRARAFSLLGLSHYVRRKPGDREVERALETVADSLVRDFRTNANPEWEWFEERLTYSNGIIPASLFAAYESTLEPDYLHVAMSSLSFLTRWVWRDGYLKLIGNDGWFSKGSKPAEYDEQPVDAGCMVQAYVAAFGATGKTEYLQLAKNSFEWFLGRNFVSERIYNPETGGCYDGLTPAGPNRNQGAESLLAFLLSHLALAECHELQLDVA